MTTPVDPGAKTQLYSNELIQWAGRDYSGAARDRLTDMLAKLTLVVLAKKDKNIGADSEAHPTKNKVNVLHFQSTNGQWYCLVLESDPADMSTPLVFGLCDSTGSQGSRVPGKVAVLLNSNMSVNDLYGAIP